MKQNIFTGIPLEILKKRIKEKQPDFIQPMLATLTKDYFSKKNWVYEHKFDGVRCLAYKKNGKVKLLSRNDNNMNYDDDNDHNDNYNDNNRVLLFTNRKIAKPVSKLMKKKAN